MARQHVMSTVRWERGALVLVRMPDKGLAGMGAVCLDGSDAGFYLSLGSGSTWQLFFEGGGWCYSELDCWSRSFGRLGSSAGWSESYGDLGGLWAPGERPDCCWADLLAGLVQDKLPHVLHLRPQGRRVVSPQILL